MVVALFDKIVRHRFETLVGCFFRTCYGGVGNTHSRTPNMARWI